MSKTVGVVLTIAAIAFAIAVPIIGPTALAAAGLTSGVITAIGAALSAAIMVNSLLMPRPQVSRNAQETILQFGEVARRAIFGRRATAGSLVDGFNYGGKYGTDHEVVIFALADHKCHALVGFYVNDEYITYVGDGDYPHFKGSLQVYFRNGTEDQVLPSVVTSHAPLDWAAADNGAGICYAVVDYKADKPDAKHPVWPGGRPTFLWVVDGKECYDPRQDSTVPGGSGSHRWADPSTWEWSENPIVCVYNWRRGVFACDLVDQPEMLLVGRGLTATEAPPQNIIAAANLCDESLGERPYYEAPTTIDDIADFHQMTVSGNGRWMARRYVDRMEVWDLLTRTVVGSGSYSSPGFGGLAAGFSVGNDGTVSWLSHGDQLHSFSSAGVETLTPTDFGSISVGFISFAIECSTGNVVLSTGSGSTGYFNGADYIADTKDSKAFCVHPDGSVWGLFQPTGSSNQFELRQVVGGSDSHVLTGPVTRSAPTGDCQLCYSSDYSHFFIAIDGHAVTVDDASFTVTDHGALGAAYLWDMPFNRTSAKSFWSYFTEYSLADGSVLQVRSATDWPPAEVGFSGTCYDPTNNALMTAANGTTPVTIEWLLLNPPLRFTVAAIIAADQKYLEVEEIFAAAVGGIIIQPEGSVEIEPAQSRTPSFFFTDDDLLATSDVQYNERILSRADTEWVNTVIPRYVEPNQKWADHAAPIRRVQDDVIDDEGSREQNVVLEAVRVERQASVIGEIHRRLGRLWGRGEVTLGPRFAEVEEGDWGIWTSQRRLNGGSMTLRVESFALDGKWQNRLKFREIAASVYADDVTNTTGSSDPFEPTPPPPDIGMPDAANWALAAVTLDSAGASIPALEITGSTADDDSTEAVIVEYWLDDGVTDPIADPDAVPWWFGGRVPPSDAVKVDITSIIGGRTYYAAVSYVVSGETGDRLVLGPVTVSDFSTDRILLEDGSTLLLLEDGITPFYLEH